MKLSKAIAVPMISGLLSLPAFAQGDAGFLVGAGGFVAANSDCDRCDYGGGYVEAGYDFNNIVGIEGKFVFGESDDGYSDIEVGYIGANIGHDFNTGWFRLYGKVGVMSGTEEVSTRRGGYEIGSYSNSGFTLGAGARFTVSGEAQGLYFKIESVGIAMENDSASAAVLLGMGYRF